MSIFKKASAFLTAVGIACSCAACGYNTINALNVDGYDVPAGVYIYYANSAYSDALSKLQEENADLDTTDTAAVKALTLEGKPVTTWIQDEATEKCAEFVMIEKKFDELGLELDEESKSNISMMKDYYWANSQETFEKNGISESSFDKILTSSYKSDKIYEYYYGIGGENGVTEEDAYNYYKENNIRADYITISLKDAEGNLLKSDGKAEMMKMAEDYQKRAEEALKDGGIDGVKAEMDSIREDYAAYTEALAAEASGEEDAADEITIDEAVEASVAEEEAAEETVEETAEETAKESAEDSAAEDSEEDTTEAETAEGEVVAETFNEAASESEEPETAEESETDAENETETAAEDDTTEAEEADTEDTESEEETEEETEEASDEDGEEEADEITEDAELLTAEEETVDPFANESIISVIHEEDYDDPDSISYNPSEKTYKKLLEISEKDYGKVYIVEEDENYYLVTRYDIEDRMTEDDLWSESNQESTVYSMHSKDFEDLLKEWASAANIQRNAAAYKRYDPFKFDFS